ncbi:MAG: FecR family protein [Candidatus Omnitrophota bacterium]
MNKRHILSLALSVFFASSGISYPQAEPGIGTVTSVEGAADILRPGAAEAVFLKENDTVSLKDRIRTKSYSKVKVTFRDNSVIKLAPNSCVIVDEYLIGANDKRELARLSLTRGTIEAVVSKTGRPDTFLIATPNALGRVKGSDIFVSYQAGRTGVLVKEGLISLLNQALPETKVDVGKGNSSMVVFKDAPQEPRPSLDAEMALNKKIVEPALTKKWVSYKGASMMTASITDMAGEVRIYKKGSEDFRMAKVNEVVYEGDKLQAGEGGRAEVRLSNGNLIIIQSNTELAIIKLQYDPATGEFENTFESKNGKIKAVIEKLGKKSTFQVKTPTATCGARGTVMYLDIQPAGTQAFYEGGGGFITSAVSGQTMTVEPGQNSIVDASGAISAPVFTSTEQKTDLDQSYGAGAMADGYSNPSDTTAAEAGTTLVAGEGAKFAEAVETTSTASMGDIMATTDNRPTFDEVVNTPVTYSPYDTITTLDKSRSSAEFQSTAAVTVEMYLEADKTWTAAISGSFDLLPTNDWHIHCTNTATDDTVTIQPPGSWSGGTWTGTVTGYIDGGGLDRDATGTASGTYNGSLHTFDGTASGTWVAPDD